MTKYNVGDTVKVKNNLSMLDEYYMEGYECEENVVPDMMQFVGKEVKIIECSPIGYTIEGNSWNWVDGMFE